MVIYLEMGGGYIKRIIKREEASEYGIFLVYYTDSRDYDIYIPVSENKYNVIPDCGWGFKHPARILDEDIVLELTEEEIMEHVILELM